MRGTRRTTAALLQATALEALGAEALVPKVLEILLKW